jgi:hypothetical protein
MAQYDAVIRRGTDNSVTLLRRQKEICRPLTSNEGRDLPGKTRQHLFQLTIPTLAVVGSAVCKETPDTTL